VLPNASEEGQAITGGRFEALHEPLKVIRIKAKERRKKRKKAARIELLKKPQERLDADDTLYGLVLLPYTSAAAASSLRPAFASEAILPMPLNVELTVFRSPFDSGSTLCNSDLRRALDGAYPLITAAKTIAQQSQLALLKAAQEPDRLFLENVIKPDGLDGPIWRSKVYNETLDRSNDDSQGRGQPP